MLALIERGYSLVADDVTQLLRRRSRGHGDSGELTRNHMEMRGIGIIDVANMFGIDSIESRSVLDLIVTLKEWNDVDEVDRIGIEREFVKVLGIRIPHITIPVRPGHDMARLIEVAAMDGSENQNSVSIQQVSLPRAKC